MRLVFFGTSQFAVPSLEALVKSRHKILAVVTQPDRRKGRFQQIASPPVKGAAAELKVAPILQPEDLKNYEFISTLKSLNVEILVVISYGNILKKEILDIPKKFCINLHASVLPKYRGAAPINWVLINGETETGVTVIKMNEKMDEGDIILQKKIPVMTADTAESLSENLSFLGAQTLLEALSQVESNKAEFRPQDNKKATYAPKLKKTDGLIDWQKTALEVLNKIRGVIPWPGAYTYLEGKVLKIWKAGMYATDVSGMPGQILGIEKDGILVATKKGALIIEEVQIESSRRMDVNAFVAGHKIKKGDMLGK